MGSHCEKSFRIHLSNQKRVPGCLGYMYKVYKLYKEDYTAHLYADYNKPLNYSGISEISVQQPCSISMESLRLLFFSRLISNAGSDSRNIFDFAAWRQFCSPYERYC